jgi:hypothetical protein
MKRKMFWYSGVLLLAAIIVGAAVLPWRQTSAAVTPAAPRLSGTYNISFTQVCPINVSVVQDGGSPPGNGDVAEVNINDPGGYSESVGTVSFTAGKVAGQGTFSTGNLTTYGGSLLFATNVSGLQHFAARSNPPLSGTYLTTPSTPTAAGTVLLCPGPDAPTPCNADAAQAAGFDFQATYTLVNGVVQHGGFVNLQVDLAPSPVVQPACLEKGEVDRQ